MNALNIDYKDALIVYRHIQHTTVHTFKINLILLVTICTVKMFPTIWRMKYGKHLTTKHLMKIKIAFMWNLVSKLNVIFIWSF